MSKGAGRVPRGVNGVGFLERGPYGNRRLAHRWSEIVNRAARTGRPQRAAVGASAATSKDPGAVYRRAMSAHGRLGLIKFMLQRVTGGLYVEREETPKRGLRTVQSIAFADPDGFERWCDDDPVRFEHPLLHVQLRREGGELWRIAAGSEGP